MADGNFSQSECSGLWLLSANHGILGSLGAVPNLATTSIQVQRGAHIIGLFCIVCQR